MDSSGLPGVRRYAANWQAVSVVKTHLYGYRIYEVGPHQRNSGRNTTKRYGAGQS